MGIVITLHHHLVVVLVHHQIINIIVMIHVQALQVQQNHVNKILRIIVLIHKLI